MGDGCEAFVDNYLQIYDKGKCEDFDNDKSGNKEIKRHYLVDYWIPAANNLKTYGRWALLEVKDIDQLENLINDKAVQL